MRPHRGQLAIPLAGDAGGRRSSSIAMLQTRRQQAWQRPGAWRTVLQRGIYGSWFAVTLDCCGKVSGQWSAPTEDALPTDAGNTQARRKRNATPGTTKKGTGKNLTDRAHAPSNHHSTEQNNTEYLASKSLE